jgi:hypothetical protein
MGFFKDMPKIYKGLLYIFFAIDLWLLGMIAIFRLIAAQMRNASFIGPGMIIILIYFGVLLALAVIGVIAVLQALNERKKKTNAN